MEFHPSALVTSDATAWDDLADWGRDVKHELDSVNRQREEFRQETAKRELALQKAATDLEAREQVLTEELRTLREALSREHSSLEMESLLLREQRGRMEVRERDLNCAAARSRRP